MHLGNTVAKEELELCRVPYRSTAMQQRRAVKYATVQGKGWASSDPGP